MELRKCKNKKCQKCLPEGYKHRYCENCRNEHIKQIKDAGTGIASVAICTVLAVFTKGKINLKK